MEKMFFKKDTPATQPPQEEQIKQHSETAPPSIFDSQEKIIQLARKLENVYDNRPDEMSFIGAQKGRPKEKEYSEEAIKKDVSYVEGIKEKIAIQNASEGKEDLEKNEQNFQMSEMMQAMIVDRINGGWFGDMKAIMSSEYDDIVKGVDAVMQSKDQQKKNTYIGTSFDFTLATRTDVATRKLANNWQKVRSGEVPTIKYFIDPETKEKRPLSLPKCIIMGTRQDIEDLATAYLENNNDAKDNHPFRFIMIAQIEDQLEKALLFYDQEKQLHPHITKYDFAQKVYSKALDTVRAMKKDITMQDTLSQHPEIYQKMKESKETAFIKDFLTKETTID